MTETSIPIGPVHVLVVDDEESVRSTLAANLELAGFDVAEAASVREAVEHLRLRRVDVVVSDVRMPERDGVSGLDDLRAVQPDLPAVLITGYDADGVVGPAMAKGAYTVLRKPVSVERVVDVVRRGARRPTVLVIDDEVEFLEALVANVRELGISVDLAIDGGTAMHLLETKNVDLCVVDLVHGPEAGAEVATRIRARFPDVGVIAMTGHDVADMVRTAFRAGAAHCLRKPFELHLLTRLIARSRSDRPLGKVAS
jgi:DNA-binding NtrC family response regulator